MACGVSCSDVVVVVAAVVVHAGEKLLKSKTSLPKNRAQVRINFKASIFKSYFANCDCPNSTVSIFLPSHHAPFMVFKS